MVTNLRSNINTFYDWAVAKGWFRTHHFQDEDGKGVMRFVAPSGLEVEIHFDQKSEIYEVNSNIISIEH
jgi:hypothetical protein